MAANDLFLLNEDTAQRMANAVRQVEANPPKKKTDKTRRDRGRQLIGKITAAGGGGAGYYDVEQVAWNGAAWAAPANKLIWDGGANLPEVYELNGTAGIAVDTIIFPYLIGATDGTFQWVFGAGGDGRIKVSANDTTPNYLENKLVAGTYIDLTVNNDGGNETITIDVDLTELPSHVLGNDQVIVHAAGAAPKWADLATFSCPP